MSPTQSHRDLKVWQIAIDLAETLYRITASWPRHELYGLVSQTRRAVVSVSANLAEGAGRRTTGEFLQFVGVARGSIAETETLLAIARRLGYIDNDTYLHLLDDVAEVGRMLTGLMNSLEQRRRSR